jgi:2,4-didehydro-3-deoxy-L-rhamnonate hydrolase
MKLASIRHQDQDLVTVALDDKTLVSVDDLLDGLSPRPTQARFTDMLAVIEEGRPLLEALARSLAAVEEGASNPPRIAADDVRWHPPVRRPGKICGVAMNNSASNERKISAPDHPAFFLKPPSCLVGHGEPIRIREHYGSVHPEPELALVIGRRVRDLPAAEALDATFGYTIFDDVTGNGMRAEDRFHYYAVYAKTDNPDETERVEQHLSYAARYKGADTFGPMGPWLVTRDEIPNPDDLSVRCKVAGEVVADDSTRYYNYKVAEVISFLSRFQTLEPGDVISLGTAFKPSANRKSIHHANLQIVGGPVEITIEGLGTQRNPVLIETMELGQWRLS